MTKEITVKINLSLFGEGGAGDGGAAGAPAAETGGGAEAEVVYGKQPEGQQAAGPETAKQEPEPGAARSKAELKADFERLIKGEYKDIYDERVQSRINERFKHTKGLEEQINALNPLAEALAARYGKDARDIEGLLTALDEDDLYLESEAEAQGLTREQLRRQKRLERENAQLQRAMAEQRRREGANQVYARWNQQAEAARTVYNGLDLETELTHPETGERFAGLLRSGVDVRTAYEVIHKDEIIGGAMQYTAQMVQQKTINDVRARGLRPQEAGGGGKGASKVVKSDPKTFTRKDRDEIARRVMRGERIEL